MEDISINKTSRLKKILQTKGMTQKELSKLSLIPEYKISLLCQGKSKNLQLSTAKKICDAIDCSLDEAFGDILG
jgi:DNA-binding Xre family transcriptional regulator